MNSDYSDGLLGLIDADLGGGVIKQRMAREGQGKSGGYRSIVLFRRGSKAFFVYGFAKRDKDNIRRDELKAFRKLADEMLMFDDKALAAAINNGTITEVRYHG